MISESSLLRVRNKFAFSSRYKQICCPILRRTSSLVIRFSSGIFEGIPYGKTVSPPSVSPRSDIYNKIVANLFPPVPLDS